MATPALPSPLASGLPSLDRSPDRRRLNPKNARTDRPDEIWFPSRLIVRPLVAAALAAFVAAGLATAIGWTMAVRTAGGIGAGLLLVAAALLAEEAVQQVKWMLRFRRRTKRRSDGAGSEDDGPRLAVVRLDDDAWETFVRQRRPDRRSLAFGVMSACLLGGLVAGTLGRSPGAVLAEHPQTSYLIGAVCGLAAGLVGQRLVARWDDRVERERLARGGWLAVTPRDIYLTGFRRRLASTERLTLEGPGGGSDFAVLRVAAFNNESQSPARPAAGRDWWPVPRESVPELLAVLDDRKRIVLDSAEAS